MKNKICFALLAIAVLCAGVLAQSVTVTGKKVVYTRPKPIMAEKKTFWINHPRVRAASPTLSRKIQSAISFEKVIPLNVNEEITDVQWLEQADFLVDYNKNDTLTVTMTIYGSGAYPSSSNKTVVVDTRTGVRVTPGDIFVNLEGLATMIKRAQSEEIVAGIVEIKKDPEMNETDPASLLADADFTAADLNAFSVGDKGVTFIYEYGFPHVIQALEPEGKYFFTWDQLRPYIKPGGLLTRIAR
jgi:hypothetical protein